MSKISSKSPTRFSPIHPVTIGGVGHDVNGKHIWTSDRFFSIAEMHEVPDMLAAMRQAAREAGCHTYTFSLGVHGVLFDH
jgi:hypothetical protein